MKATYSASSVIRILSKSDYIMLNITCTTIIVYTRVTKLVC